MSKSNGSTPETTIDLEDPAGLNLPTTDLAPELQRDADNDRLTKRLTELRSEFEAGQKMLSELNAKTNELQTTLLRISGAIQVLEELLAEKPKEEG